MRNLASSLLYSIGAIIGVCGLLKIDYSIIITFFTEGNLNFFKFLTGCVWIWFLLFMISTCIAFIIKSLYSLALFHYYSLFYTDREINVYVDENRIIRDSFVELSDGRVIPIKIRKIIMGKSDNEKEIQETQSGE